MNEYVFSINQKDYRAEVLELSAEQALIRVNGQDFKVLLRQLGRGKWVPATVKRAEEARTETPKPAAAAAPTPARVAGGEASHSVKAPLPGLIVEVKVQEGARVQAGQQVIVMEAMKMENQIQATCDGTIKKIFVKKGDSVPEGATLFEIERSAISNL